MIESFSPEVLALPFLLYAETHYRFRYFPSLLRKAEPEIVADAPFRIDPGRKLPILLLVKDAHKFPVRLISARVRIMQSGTVVHESDLLRQPVDLDTKWWWTIHSIDAHGLSGWVDVEVGFETKSGRQTGSYKTDNYRTSSHRPLRVFVSSHPLPGVRGIFFGDLHTHSSFTDDQVEYGAPLAAGSLLAHAAGLSFFAVTDHSYDLDDERDNYLVNDPRIPKWHDLQREIAKLKGTKGAVVIRGEEVSCRNSAGKNVHLLLLGNKRFVPGSGDGAEKWLKTRSELAIRDVLSVRENGALAFAAHPGEVVPLLQRILLGRGGWSDRDIFDEGLHGTQILNGIADSGFRRARAQWIKALLRGNRLVAIAGNDAHGNFNRFRQIGIPFFSIRESAHQIFGGVRTGVWVPGRLTERSVLEALRAGKCCVTDGPVAMVVRIPSRGAGTAPGTVQVKVACESTPEFGSCREMRLWGGVVGEKKEIELVRESGSGLFRFTKEYTLNRGNLSYLRLELVTSAENEFDQRPHFCLTNPLWL